MHDGQCVEDLIDLLKGFNPKDKLCLFSLGYDCAGGGQCSGNKVWEGADRLDFDDTKCAGYVEVSMYESSDLPEK